jgi:predicted dehydrogenase
MSFGVGIIGCGLIGQKRAKSLGEGRLVACADINDARVKALSANSGVKGFSDWRVLLTLPEVEIVIVATLHDSLAEITLAAIEAGKHVLVEKPAARNPAELVPVMVAAERYEVMVHVGFNHRYHRAFRKARELFEAGALGELMFIRARYGHGGRIGYDKEWRSDPRRSGGGEMIDQGVHIIDLARWFLGDFSQIDGFAHTYFWDMQVDDNAFMTLKTDKKQVAFLHASCTEWKNTFSFELYGKNGKLQIDGLGGSYGIERLSWYRMLPEMGPPETTIWEYPMADNSWSVEMAEFMEEIRTGKQTSSGLTDAVASLEVVEKIYRESGYDHRA